MRNTVITIAVLLALPFLLIPAHPQEINAGDWKPHLAAGFGLAGAALALGWIASRERVQQSNSRIARSLQRVASRSDSDDAD
jgi:hypothetical protein